MQKFTKGSAVIFTYINKEVRENPSSFFAANKLLQDLSEIEERWTFGFNPQELPLYLDHFNYCLIKDENAAQYRNLNVQERDKLNKGYEFYRIAYCQKKTT